MSAAETLQLYSNIAYVISGICFIATVCLWIFLKIPEVIGDLSGRTRKKSIKQKKEVNEKNSTRSQKENKRNGEPVKLTGTGLLNASAKPEKEVGTGVLDVSEKPEKKADTGILKENQSEQLVARETGLLSGENMSVSSDKVSRKKEKREGGIKLQMIEDVMLIHTEEVIG